MLPDLKSVSKKIPNLENVVDQLIIIQQRRCHKCGEYLHTIPYPHHALIHNNEPNRNNYPLLVHHPVNLVLLCQDCHSQYGMYMQIQNEKVLEHIESNLIELGDNFRYMDIKDKILYKQSFINTYTNFINWCDTDKIISHKIE